MINYNNDRVYRKINNKTKYIKFAKNRNKYFSIYIFLNFKNMNEVSRRYRIFYISYLQIYCIVLRFVGFCLAASAPWNVINIFMRIKERRKKRMSRKTESTTWIFFLLKNLGYFQVSKLPLLRTFAMTILKPKP